MIFCEQFLFHIFGYLKPFDWCRASGVCKQWKNLLYSDRLWHSAFILKWPQKASDPKVLTLTLLFLTLIQSIISRTHINIILVKFERDKKETWRERYRVSLFLSFFLLSPLTSTTLSSEFS
jgi:hypothetical protein